MRARKFRSAFTSMLMGAAASLAIAIPARSADQIYFNYGMLELSISVSSLEAFAKDGTVNPDLGQFLGFLSEKAKADLQQTLAEKHTADPVKISYSLYDPIGAQVMWYFGNLIQTGQRQNGMYALRAAFVQSAEQPDGFTITDVLRKIPTDIRIDIKRAIARAHRVDAFFRETERAIQGIQALSEAAAAEEPPLDASSLPDLSQPGPYSFSKQTLEMQDASRDRTFPVDLYLPNHNQSEPGSTRVVVISHGFGSSKEDFATFAQHFASYGFAVVVPEHIGSDKALQEAVFAGRATEFMHPIEYRDRPLDISFTLDELEKLNQSQLQGRLNLKQVLAAGHSLGGYTVLALAGATVDFENLNASCHQEAFANFLNPALLLECRALELEPSPEVVQQLTQGLRDERVTAVIAMNPVNRIIFGDEGIRKIQMPILMGAGGYDVAAPLVAEQLGAFVQLPSTDKYLMLVPGQAHTPSISDHVNQILYPTVNPALLEQEVQTMSVNGKALMTAFIQVYLAGQNQYRPLLQSAYANSLGEPPFNFSMIRTLTEAQVTEMLNPQSPTSK